jgi:hypothetical protein
MGKGIRAHLSGHGHPEADPSPGLSEADVKSALGRLEAYDGHHHDRRDRRRRVEANPPLHQRAGLWRR